MSATPTKSSAKWSEAEKNALFMAIIAAGGPINWKNVVLPPGRSQMSCWHVVDHAKKDAAKAGGIEIGDAGSSPAAPAKKSGRPKKVVADGEAGASTKRKRGKKVAEEISPDGENADGESDDGVTLKKIKKEKDSEDAGEEQGNVVNKEDSDDS